MGSHAVTHSSSVTLSNYEAKLHNGSFRVSTLSPMIPPMLLSFVSIEGKPPSGVRLTCQSIPPHD